MFDGGIPVNTIDVAVVRMSAMIRNEKIRALRVGNPYSESYFLKTLHGCVTSHGW